MHDDLIKLANAAGSVADTLRELADSELVKRAFTPMPPDMQPQGGPPQGGPPADPSQQGAPQGGPPPQGGGDPNQIIQQILQDPQTMQALMQDPQGTAQQLGIPPDVLPQVMQLVQQQMGQQGGQPQGGQPPQDGGGAAQAMQQLQQGMEMVMQKLQGFEKNVQQLVQKQHELEIKFARLDAKTETVLKTVKELDIPSEPPAPPAMAAAPQPDAAMMAQPGM